MASSTPKEAVKCINCKHATCMQWMNNPVVAQCSVTKSREVAEARRICKEYANRGTAPTIQHFDSY